MADNPIHLTVVIPVLNDRRRLAACVRSVLDAEPPEPGGLEVIVVDNGSTDGSGEDLAGLPGVRLIREPVPGSYAARNRGAEQAAGKIIAFTDSDCTVDRGWPSAIAGTLAEPDLAAVQGTTEGVPGGTVWSVYCGREYGETMERLGRDEIPGRADTRNFAVRAEVFRRLGGFLTAWPNAADWEYGARLRKAGLKLVSSSEMRVRHRDPVDLDRILEVRRRQAACMALMLDNRPYLRHHSDFGTAGRWYHGGRHIPVVRTGLHMATTGCWRLLSAWLRRFHARRCSAAGYRLYRLAGSLAGVSGIYRPEKVVET